MLFKNAKFAAVIAFAGLFSVAACGDDGDEPAPTTTAAPTTTTTTGAGADCNMVCSYVYGCGVEDMRCENFASGDVSEADFVGDSMDGCIASCEGPTGSLLQGLVDMNSCEMTVQNLENANADFATACNGELGMGGGGQGGSGQGGSAQGGSAQGGGGGA